MQSPGDESTHRTIPDRFAAREEQKHFWRTCCASPSIAGYRNMSESIASAFAIRSRLIRRQRTAEGIERIRRAVTKHGNYAQQARAERIKFRELLRACRADSAHCEIASFGKSIGPPWTADQKNACDSGRYTLEHLDKALE